MRHEVWFDEKQGVGRIKLGGASTYEEAAELLDRTKEILEGRECRDLLVDISARPGESPSKEIRDLYQSRARDMNLGRVAIVGLNPVVRMAAKIIIRTTGKSKITKFFKTEQQALFWLKSVRESEVTESSKMIN